MVSFEKSSGLIGVKTPPLIASVRYFLNCNVKSLLRGEISDDIRDNPSKL
jgi:hypothetical protein